MWVIIFGRRMGQKAAAMVVIKTRIPSAPLFIIMCIDMFATGKGRQ